MVYLSNDRPLDAPHAGMQGHIDGELIASACNSIETQSHAKMFSSLLRP